MVEYEMIDKNKKRKLNTNKYLPKISKVNKVNKLLKYLKYGFIIFGIVVMCSQIYYHGIYDIGEDATLVIVGLLIVNIGLSIN